LFCFFCFVCDASSRQVRIGNISSFTPTHVIISSKRCTSASCATFDPPLLAWPPLLVTADATVVVSGLQCSSSFLVRIAEFQWTLNPIWSPEQIFSTSTMGGVSPSTVALYMPDFGIVVAQQQSKPLGLLFASCDDAAAAGSLSCVEVQWRAVGSAHGYIVSSLTPSSSSLSSFSSSQRSIFVRNPTVALQFSLFNMSSTSSSPSVSLLPPLISITPRSHNATGSPIFLSFKPQILISSRVTSDLSLLLLLFEAQLECDLHVYVLRPHLPPQHIATLQTGTDTRLFFLRLKGQDGSSSPCSPSDRCGKLRLQLSVCYTASSVLHTLLSAPHNRAAALPWLPPFHVSVTSNMTREIVLAGGGGLYVNADALEGLGGEGGEGGDDGAMRCEIHTAAMMNFSSGIGGNSSNTNTRLRLFVFSSIFTSASLCIVAPASCMPPSQCTFSAAAAVFNTSIIEHTFKTEFLKAQPPSHFDASVLLPTPADVEAGASVRAQWAVRYSTR
jgi:hypothetical protein